MAGIGKMVNKAQQHGLVETSNILIKCIKKKRL
jgi:hypothetical protein